MRFKLKCFSAAVLVAYTGAAWAGAPQPFSDQLSLDWDGIRSDWLDKGIDVRIGYVSETATNVQGGDRELARYTDQITFLGDARSREAVRPQAGDIQVGNHRPQRR